MIDKADRFVVELKKRHAGSVVKVTGSPRYDGFAALCATWIIILERDSPSISSLVISEWI